MSEKEKDKDGVCRFCGSRVRYSKITKRVYEVGDGRILHVENCPKRARHYHEKAMDAAEEERVARIAEYNRSGTETDEGRRMAEALELLEQGDDEWPGCFFCSDPQCHNECLD